MTVHETQRRRRPWHLGVVVTVMLALYAVGARDFVLIHVWDEDYIRGLFGEAGLTYFTDYPAVLRVLWAANIVGGLVAPVALVARSRWTVPVAAVATASQLALVVVTFAGRDRWAMLGLTSSLTDLAVAVLTAAFLAYCWALRPRRTGRPQDATAPQLTPGPPPP